MIYFLADALSSNQIQIILVIGITLLTTIFLFFTYSIVRYQRKYIRLQKELTKAEVDTLEKERQRIASDLHDSIGPLLSTVKLQINSLDTQLPSDLELVEKAGVHIDTIMNSIRSVSNSLAPKILNRKGLGTAIRQLADETSSVFPVLIRYEPADIPRLQPAAELHVYRMVQEIIHNTVKHARAKTLQIQLFREKQQLILLTADDGTGFDLAEQKEQSGLGLRNIETRAGILNSYMEIRTHPGRGTSYIFELPLNDLLPPATPAEPLARQ